MGTLSREETKDMYSWWWDSHISPKNSKWLQENLTDMDNKIITMIRFIEVDEDSFARRAEMYYKKRPELMKLVEEFYRAYRALAERYDHATGVIRQAHRTMAEVFPNQVPLITDDHDLDPHTPETRPNATRSVGLSPTVFSSFKRNGDFTDEPASLACRKGSKELNDTFGPVKARKGLNFHEVDEKEGSVQDKDKEEPKGLALSESERLGKSETDIQALKEALAKLEAEKEAGLVQYQQTLERLSKLESEVARAQEDSKGFNIRASKAEAEVESLKETLAKVEAEREASLLQYQQCLEKISNLESRISCAEEDAGEFNDRASRAEKEAEDLREELARLKAEKESLLVKYMEALEKIANLENKLLLAEDYVSGISKRADKAEKEVESLKQTISRLTEEKDAAAAYYEQCLEKIASLEREIGLTQEEAERLKVEVEEGVLKLKGAEEQCRQLDISNKSLQSELDTLVHKAGLQNQEILEKQKELSRLWTCVQEERVRFMEAENAFQALQNLHSKTQEELRSVAAELQKRAQILQDMGFNNQQLQDEVKKIKDENKSLNDLKLSSDVSTKSMQDEIFSLKEGKGKLEEELKLRFDKSNALQQEIYCLKEELSDLNQKHREVLEQVESVGLAQECFGSSVKELQDENSKLKESCQKIENDKVALAEKLEIMEKLIEKNALLESSLLDLRAELEGAREKVRALEESCRQLVWDTSAIAREKTTVISQLEIATENLERLSERNSFLENSLSGANAELEVLRAKSKNLEDSCRLLNGEKSVLVAERQSLASDLDGALQSLAHLGNKHAELELRYSGIVEEQETTLRRVEELQLGLDVEKQGHANTIQLSQKQIADLESRLLVLQEAGDHMREEFEQELDKAVSAQLEIFVIQKCVQDLKKKNTSLLGYCEKLLDASKMSEKLILELEHEKFERQEEVRLLSSQIKGLRSGMFKLLKALKMETESANTDCVSEDESVLSHILAKLEDMERSLCKAWDENQELVIEKSVLVTVSRQLKQDVADLNHVISTLSRELGIRNQQLIMLQKQMQNLLKSNEELILKVKDGNLKEMALVNEIASLAVKLSNLQGAYGDLQKEKSKVIEDSSSLMKSVAQLEAEKRYLDKECSHLYGQVISLDNLCLILKCVVTEKSVQVIELNENIHKLCSANNLLEKKVRVMEGKMEEDRTKHMSLEFSLNRSEDELTELRIANDELQDEIENGKNLLQVKEIELLKAEVAKDDQDKCIRRLSQDYSEQVSECKHLQESIRNLNAQIHKICKEHTETEAKVEALNSELQKAKEEAKLWELVAGTFFTELQSSGVREALLKEKLSDLTKLYENIEGENYSKGVEIVKLRERVGVLEGENADVKAQFDTYISAISSIQDSLASLEKHTSVPGHSGVKEDAKVGSKSTEENSSIEADRLADLQDVQRRITAIEKSVVEIKSKAEHEYSTVSANLDTAMRQIKLLKSQSNSHRGTNKSGKRSEKEHKNAFSDTYKLQKLASVVSEAGDESLTKDIMLDQMSECSPLEKNKGENGKSKDQLVESWETVDQVGSIDLTVGKYPPQKGRRSSESLVEKELGVDEQEKSPGSFPTPHHEENKRVFERLASDIQKLTNLQITVQDLKAKLDSSSTDTSSKYDGVKEQLEETERGIIKWFDYVGKLMKKLERSLSSPSSFDGPSPMESSDGGSARQRSVSDKARRVSDKIGRLQMEVQKVQFLMMKLDNERPGKSGTRITERSTRILLRDYIYGGGTKTPRRPKKSHFCGCMQPPTKS